jgi:hypothetical protein
MSNVYFAFEFFDDRKRIASPHVAWGSRVIAQAAGWCSAVVEQKA